MGKTQVYGVPELKSSQKGIILFALALVFFFNNGDTSLLSSAAPTILADIGGSEVYALLFSVKMLTNAVFMLLSGKLSDKFGRRNVMLVGLCLIFAGYLGGGFSGTIGVMIAWRAITGIGSGLSFGLGYIVLGDLFQGSSYAKAYMVQVIASAVALVGGPILGGVLVTYLPWHWAFWALVPMTVIAIILLFIFCPNYKIDTPDRKLDTFGMIFFALAMSLLLFVLSVAGSFFAWTDPLMIGCLVIAAVLFIIFFAHERKVDIHSAILPVKLFKNRAVGISAIGQLCMTLNSLCLLTYIPYFMQTAMGESATVSGYILSLIYIVSTVFGLFITRSLGKNMKYGFWSRFTVVGEGIALVLVCTLLSPTISLMMLAALMIVYGLFASVEGTVFIMSSQVSMSPSMMAVGTSCLTFVQAAASCLGSAVGGTIINSSADFISGMINVFMFAAIITVIGAVIVCWKMPGKQYMEEMKQKYIAADNAAENK